MKLENQGYNSSSGKRLLVAERSLSNGGLSQLSAGAEGQHFAEGGPAIHTDEVSQ